MERNKVLMVIVSVTLFLAAIVGISMFLLYPHDPETPQEARAADETRERFDPIEYMRRPEELPRLTLREPDPEEDVIIIYGERDEPPVRPEEPEVDPSEEVPRVELPEHVDPELEPEPEPVEPTPPERVTELVPAEPAPPEPVRPDAEPRVAPREPERPAPEPEHRPEPEVRRERVTEYWIQVISSPRRDTVDRARSRLDQRDLGTRVTTAEVSGSTYFRLRIGPYRHKAEARKFLEIISDLEGFESSYISEEYPLRTVTR